VALAADRRHAFISIYGTKDSPGSALSVIDLDTHAERRIDLGDLRRPHGLQMAGGKLFLTAEGSQSVARFDVASGKVDWVGKTAKPVTHMLAVSADAKTLYAVNLMADSVSVFDVAAGGSEPVAEIAVGKGPEGVALSPDGKELWIGNRGSGAISIIDTRTRKVVDTIAPSIVAGRLKFTPDGKRVLASDLASGRLVVFDAATRKETGHIDAGALPITVFVAPDSKRAWASALPTNELLAIDLETLKVTGRVAVGAGADGVAVRLDAKP
jgi:YVTN family beta-propeller protein